MSKLNINIEHYAPEYTVSEMRIRLAQVLSKLNGDQTVTFSFRAELPDYKPAPKSTDSVCPVCHGYPEPAAHCLNCNRTGFVQAANTRQATMPDILGAPYDLASVATDDPYEDFARLRAWDYVTGSRDTDRLVEGDNLVHGPLARPENN